MKKLFGLLTLAGIAGAAFVTLQNASDAMPPPPLPAVRVVCDGSNPCCGILIPTLYFYRVQIPGGVATQVTRMDFGTDDGNINRYANWIEPAGWTHQILAAPPVQPDRQGCLLHGTTNVVSTGNCPYIVRFSTTTNPMSSNFTLGFDNEDPAHEVNWKASTPNQANWAKALGLGDGCVHGPGND